MSKSKIKISKETYTITRNWLCLDNNRPHRLNGPAIEILFIKGSKDYITHFYENGYRQYTAKNKT